MTTSRHTWLVVAALTCGPVVAAGCNAGKIRTLERTIISTEQELASAEALVSRLQDRLADERAVGERLERLGEQQEEQVDRLNTELGDQQDLLQVTRGNYESCVAKISEAEMSTRIELLERIDGLEESIPQRERAAFAEGANAVLSAVSLAVTTRSIDRAILADRHFVRVRLVVQDNVVSDTEFETVRPERGFTSILAGLVDLGALVARLIIRRDV